MKNKLIKSALLGGLIVFAWGYISWMVLPFHKMNFKCFKNEEQVQSVIKNNAVGNGIYVLPHCCNPNKDELCSARKGPTMFAAVRMCGHHMELHHLGIALLTEIFGAAIIAWMLLQTKIKEYQKQVLFVTAAGFLVGLLGLVPSWNWWGFPTGYTAVLWLDLVVGWFLAGLAMVKICRSR